MRGSPPEDASNRAKAAEPAAAVESRGAKDCVNSYISHHQSLAPAAEDAPAVVTAEKAGGRGFGLRGTVTTTLGVAVTESTVALGDGVKSLLQSRRRAEDGGMGILSVAEGEEGEEDESPQLPPRRLLGIGIPPGESVAVVQAEETEEEALRRVATEQAAEDALFSVKARRMSEDGAAPLD